MRKFFFSFLFLICGVCAFANPVTQEQALQKARNFLQTRGMMANADMQLAFQGKQTAHQHGAPAKNAYYYIFNNGNDAGFVIVAGDDCVEEVLGYADSGSFCADQMPDNLRTWLDSYADQIAWARANMAQASSQDNGNIEEARRVIAPLVTAHWNQYDPYNLQCPLYGPGGTSGDRCITGCVAVAMSQVMYYHKWPQEKTTAIPSYKSNSVIGTLPELSAMKFDWDNMSDNYAIIPNEGDARREAVAWLFRYTGQSVEMDYTPNGSGGITTYIPKALKTMENSIFWWTIH